jgi:hypothetical protein
MQLGSWRANLHGKLQQRPNMPHAYDPHHFYMQPKPSIPQAVLSEVQRLLVVRAKNSACIKP